MPILSKTMKMAKSCPLSRTISPLMITWTGDAVFLQEAVVAAVEKVVHRESRQIQPQTSIKFSTV